MPESASPIDEQAIAWTIAVRDAGFDDWDALTLWLEADPGHSEAFDRLTMLDAMLPQIILPRQNADGTGGRVQRFRWSATRLGALAAAFVAILTFTLYIAQPPTYAIETQAGERRAIVLEDGSRIDLNGDTRIILSKKDSRHAVLDKGEALFTVVHNDRDPFDVEVGGALVRDAGTVFNIVHAGKSTEVGVSEGLVVYNPQKEKLSLAPGRGLRVEGEGRPPVTFAVPRDAVGSWQRGQLSFNAAPMERVAGDLARSLGVRISVSPQIRATRFTGTLNLKKEASSFLEVAAPVMGVRALQTKDGWILVGGDETLR